MEYRKLGKWGMRVSEISLGSWLTYGHAVDEKATAEQVHYAFEKGINFFDTANVYAHGEAEVTIGKALKSFRRDECVIATKVFFPVGNGPNDRGLSRKHIFEQCHRSLQRLGTDYIDLYQCHRADPDVPMYELVRAMDDLIRNGKILYWGVSEWNADQIQDAVETALACNAMPPASNQPQYNMLSRRIESTVVPTSTRLGLGQVCFSPLAQGVLTGKYKPGEAVPSDSRAADERQNAFLVGRQTMTKDALETVHRLVGVATELGITMSQLALAWCLRLPNVSSVITGATRTQQIDENVKASGMKLPPEILSRIDDLLEAVSSASR